MNNGVIATDFLLEHTDDGEVGDIPHLVEVLAKGD